MPAATTAQYGTKGTKRPHKNVDNPGPKRRHFDPDVVAAIHPPALHCVDKPATKTASGARGPRVGHSVTCARASLRLGLNFRNAVLRTVTSAGFGHRGRKKCCRSQACAS